MHSGQFLRQSLATTRVPLVEHFLQECGIGLATLEVPTAPQPEGLIQRLFQMAMQRFDIAILVRLARIRFLDLQLIVIHQRLVPMGEFSLIREIVDGGT
jgi:hypothetical protein